MNTYFRLGENGYFNGVDQFDTCPEGWLNIRPPDIDFMSKKARWTGTEWIIEEI